MKFELVLVDTNKELCCELQHSFESLEGVSIVHGSFTDVEDWDCLITPGNSYGIMDGGFDLRAAKFFGPELEPRVRSNIFAVHAGIQPVGTSLIVPTDNQNHPFLSYTPTMRVPMPIVGTINVFLAMKAALQTISHHNDFAGGKWRIRKVICPGLGTATGHVSYEVAAYQMRLAYDVVSDPIARSTWEKVEEFERQLVRRPSCVNPT
ncbi:hypothetical protein WMW72_33980 [Paenibacillus filicis]|uniref:Macro domain-containing protein n=1 Tax=Paenibacillus filicis TaxID=669464 RepID=A0ABU9DXP6_9BACL